jgi:hypothetical protein
MWWHLMAFVSTPVKHLSERNRSDVSSDVHVKTSLILKQIARLSLRDLRSLAPGSSREGGEQQVRGWSFSMRRTSIDSRLTEVAKICYAGVTRAHPQSIREGDESHGFLTQTSLNSPMLRHTKVSCRNISVQRINRCCMRDSAFMRARVAKSPQRTSSSHCIRSLIEKRALPIGQSVQFRAWIRTLCSLAVQDVHALSRPCRCWGGSA